MKIRSLFASTEIDDFFYSKPSTTLPIPNKGRFGTFKWGSKFSINPTIDSCSRFQFPLRNIIADVVRSGSDFQLNRIGLTELGASARKWVSFPVVVRISQSFQPHSSTPLGTPILIIDKLQKLLNIIANQPCHTFLEFFLLLLLLSKSLDLWILSSLFCHFLDTVSKYHVVSKAYHRH